MHPVHKAQPSSEQPTPVVLASAFFAERRQITLVAACAVSGTETENCLRFDSARRQGHPGALTALFNVFLSPPKSFLFSAETTD